MKYAIEYVNVKNARVRARAEVSCGRYDAIPCCGGKDCIFGFYPLVNEVIKT